ncbi:thiamine pyrophosphokinase-like protein 1 [Byssothecium circinans]|uniref:Thiamine pyrophosphokinase n=1 Tax=Byssothecium circinans TaxID=147558 RepID=A0A6A5TKV1_9PLEO|nr:thiamine pyrophosphokinase-like protein 1 [Byssothecium circinans]
MSARATSVFDPALFLAGDNVPADVAPPDLLILNQPISNFALFSRLWRHTDYRICADGGANRLFDMFEGELNKQKSDYLPSAIHGDLDSLRDDVRAYYTGCGVEVTQDHDQYSTDFAKTMRKISSKRSVSSSRRVFVLGSLAGRVDQGLGLLHEMIREETKDPNLQIWLFSESNLSFILKSHHNLIRGTLSSKLFTENVGIVPVYGPATITTSGLEWDVKEWDTQMGHQVSTSNHVKADEVQIHTNAPVLFTIERAATNATTVAKRPH